MEIRKTPAADLENKRGLFFLAGLIVALTGFYFIMEIKTGDDGNRADGLESLVLLPVEEEFAGGFLKMPDAVIPEQTPEIEKQNVYEGFQAVEKITEPQEESPDLAAALFPEEMEKSQEENPLNFDDANSEQTEVSVAARVMPQFRGGKAALARYIYSSIKYPEAAVKQKKQGRVWCSFNVNEDGSVTDVILEKGVDIFLDEETVRVLRSMPNWIPGEENGKKRRVKVYLPVVFRL